MRIIDQVVPICLIFGIIFGWLLKHFYDGDLNRKIKEVKKSGERKET